MSVQFPPFASIFTSIMSPSTILKSRKQINNLCQEYLRYLDNFLLECCRSVFVMDWVSVKMKANWFFICILFENGKIFYYYILPIQLLYWVNLRFSRSKISWAFSSVFAWWLWISERSSTLVTRLSNRYSQIPEEAKSGKYFSMRNRNDYLLYF